MDGGDQSDPVISPSMSSTTYSYDKQNSFIIKNTTQDDG